MTLGTRMMFSMKLADLDQMISHKDAKDSQSRIETFATLREIKAEKSYVVQECDARNDE